MPVLVLETTQVQKALSVLSAQDPTIPSPGAVDGLWGAHTAASLASWSSANPQLGTALYSTPAARATTVQLNPGPGGVLQSAAAIYDGQANVYRSAGAVAEREGVLPPGLPTSGATTPAQRSAASAAISTGSGRGVLAPAGSSSLLPPLMLNQKQDGWLGVSWWIWGLLGIGAVATAGGLYWYWQYGRKHRSVHHLTRRKHH
jgi:hypothetical protein